MKITIIKPWNPPWLRLRRLQLSQFNALFRKLKIISCSRHFCEEARTLNLNLQDFLYTLLYWRVEEFETRRKFNLIQNQGEN